MFVCFEACNSDLHTVCTCTQIRKVFPSADEFQVVEHQRGAIDKTVTAIRNAGGLRFFRLEVISYVIPWLCAAECCLCLYANISVVVEEGWDRV
jgi:hypothetical protein